MQYAILTVFAVDAAVYFSIHHMSHLVQMWRAKHTHTHTEKRHLICNVFRRPKPGEVLYKTNRTTQKTILFFSVRPEILFFSFWPGDRCRASSLFLRYTLRRICYPSSVLCFVLWDYSAPPLAPPAMKPKERKKERKARTGLPPLWFGFNYKLSGLSSSCLFFSVSSDVSGFYFIFLLWSFVEFCLFSLSPKNYTKYGKHVLWAPERWGCLC